MAARCVFNGNNFAHLQQRIGSNGWRPSEALPPSPSHTLFVQCYYSLSQWQRGRKTTRTTAAASPRLGRESQSRSAGRPPSLPPSLLLDSGPRPLHPRLLARPVREMPVRPRTVRPSVRPRPSVPLGFLSSSAFHSLLFETWRSEREGTTGAGTTEGGREAWPGWWNK